MMMFTKKFEIKRAPSLTEIHFQEGLFPTKLDLPYLEKIALLMDENIEKIYGRELRASFGESVKIYTVPTGENAKNRLVKEEFEDWLLQEQFGKDSHLFACGGGSVLDLAGFVAATFCRGIHLYFIPTTLLAMVDAGLGGKNGINLKSAKNYLGTTYFPVKTFIDPLFLKTLPRQELKNGFSEMIKHGALFNSAYFESLSSHYLELEKLEKTFLDDAIIKSIEIKMSVILDDPDERGKRHLLNFGHTIGHALESVEKYRISHGEAVAMGMAAESFLSFQARLLSEIEFKKILTCIFSYHKKLSLPKTATIEALTAALLFDKKRRKNQTRFVLLEKIGKAHVKDDQYTHFLEANEINKCIEWLQKAF